MNSRPIRLGWKTRSRIESRLSKLETMNRQIAHGCRESKFSLRKTMTLYESCMRPLGTMACLRFIVNAKDMLLAGQSTSESDYVAVCEVLIKFPVNIIRLSPKLQADLLMCLKTCSRGRYFSTQCICNLRIINQVRASILESLTASSNKNSNRKKRSWQPFMTSNQNKIARAEIIETLNGQQERVTISIKTQVLSGFSIWWQTRFIKIA